MISSANLWAIWRAVSSLAVSVYCLAKIWGYGGFLVSSRKPLTMRRPPLTARLPKATMAALAGAADHCARLISDGFRVWPGGQVLETRSKMPALERSVKRVLSKVLLSGRWPGSARCGFEVGDGETDVVGAGGCFDMEPVLRVEGGHEQTRRRRASAARWRLLVSGRLVRISCMVHARRRPGCIVFRPSSVSVDEMELTTLWILLALVVKRVFHGDVVARGQGAEVCRRVAGRGGGGVERGRSTAFSMRMLAGMPSRLMSKRIVTRLPCEVVGRPPGCTSSGPRCC